jgi:hypothetical protein
MSQLSQALEVIKDLSQVKNKLLKDKIELRSILMITQDVKRNDQSISGLTWHALNYVLFKTEELIMVIDRFNAARKTEETEKLTILGEEST